MQSDLWHKGLTMKFLGIIPQEEERCYFNVSSG